MNTFLTLLLSLLVLHFLVDFYWQPADWVKDKNKKHAKSLKLFYHSACQAIVSLIPLLFITTDWRSILSLFAIVGISHWAIDLFKTYKPKSLSYLILDQLAHIAVLAWVAQHALQTEWSWSSLTDSLFTEKNLLIMLGYIIILKPVSIVIGSILKKYTPELDDSNKGLISGGEVIGYLERTLILTFSIIGQFAVIGFILAAKSIFRFGDLNNKNKHQLTEYVLLGSLLSVTITSVIGLAIKTSVTALA